MSSYWQTQVAKQVHGKDRAGHWNHSRFSTTLMSSYCIGYIALLLLLVTNHETKPKLFRISCLFRFSKMASSAANMLVSPSVSEICKVLKYGFLQIFTSAMWFGQRCAAVTQVAIVFFFGNYTAGETPGGTSLIVMAWMYSSLHLLSCGWQLRDPSAFFI